MEPTVTSWERLSESELGRRTRALLPEATRALVLVDGRSGGGKSTFARLLAHVLDGAVVHTDDIAWAHSRFDWSGALLDGVITPWRRGTVVSFRPPGWGRAGRPGTVVVPSCPVLIAEGVGAGRAELAAHADLVIWVRSDRDEARRRGVARDVQELGRSPDEAESFWDEWMQEEEPFLATDRPWSRASLVVDGTPPPGRRDLTWISPGPLGRHPQPARRATCRKLR